MKARWFKKHGYQAVDRSGIQTLLWKPFTHDASPPRWIDPGSKPQPVEGKVTVTGYINGWCPAQNLVYERAKRAAAVLGEDVVFESHDTSEQADMIACGQGDCVYLDGKSLQKGPPPSYDRISKKIEGRVKRLKK